MLKKDNQDLVLLDEEFLATLSEQKNREIYARITSLDFNEQPIDQIEGRVSSGNINIDGSSAIRRTCSLTMITEDIDINEFYWSIKTKFKLEIGLKNKLKNQYMPTEENIYPEIVWFLQGTYIITTFNTSISTNNCTISLSGKDKMCMLNGELGGQLFASIDFGTEETETKVMKEITNLSIISSDTLMTNVYYKKLLKKDFPKNIDGVYIDIFSNDNLYSFILSDEGSYYKNGNKYSVFEEGVLTSKRYDVYKKVTEPKELFEPSFENYQAGQYYYEKKENTQYYVLDNGSTANPEVDYYKLIPLYKEEYSYNIVKIPLEKIIRESVHTYAKEPYYNIIINDLDDYGLEQLTYKGDKILYALRNKNTGHFTQLILSDKNESLENCLINKSDFVFDALNPTANVDSTIIYYYNQEFHLNNNENIETIPYTIAKISYGDDLGYRVVDLVYNGDLISSIGDSLVTILDKIKTMLGDFEYFYDLNGRFVFQRKRTYVNTVWSKITETEDETYVDYINSDRKKFSFNFEGNRLVSSVQNSPNLANLKNDFSVWGKRKSVSGAEIPIHARYAIDKKPVFYKALDGKVYATDKEYIIEQLGVFDNDIPSQVYREILNFSMDYELPNFLKDYAPKKNRDGSWSPGWWDIRDWARFYVLLTGSNTPNGTMKFYSKGDETGFMHTSQLDLDVTSHKNVWLMEVYEDGRINLGHNGSGEYGENAAICTYYNSILDNDEITSTKTDLKKEFFAPYKGCSDTHTYLYFLNQIQTNNRKVYFYNPNFPTISYENIIDAKIAQAYEKWEQENQCYIVDWRELIYQMALDYFAGQGCSIDNPIYLSDGGVLTDPDHFLYEVASRNPYYFPTGITGYEQYYTDMEGFWRQLYNPNYVPVAKYKDGEYITEIQQNPDSIYFSKFKTWSEMQLIDYDIDYYVNANNVNVNNQYNNLLELINTSNDSNKTEELKKIKNKYEQYQINIFSDDDKKDRLYWNVAVFEAPETLNFWIEFLDSGVDLAQFSIPMVGDRSKSLNEDKANAIVYREIPDVILYDVYNNYSDGPNFSKIRKEISENTGYTFIYLPKGFSQYLTISYRGKSIKDKIDELLYDFACCIENISITTIPIYHLEPNTRIYVQDKTTKINGEYIVNKITLPLTYNGTMSITATKALERLY